MLASLGLSFAAVPMARAGAVPSPPLAASVAPAATLHGDLIVSAANSPFVISPATTGSALYAQQGNVTVLAGGTLIVRGETLDFVQFVADTGTLANRVAHLYHFSVQGTVSLDNSTVTTDTGVINAYTKLLFNVSAGGNVTLASSTLAFPGWLEVSGAGASMTLENSAITPNAAISQLNENVSILGDTVYGPSISVSAGAALNLFNSTVSATYKDNLLSSGVPGPLPVTDAGHFALNVSGGQTLSSWPTPTDSENVSRAMLYPTFAGGTISLTYSSTSASVSTGSTFGFAGNTYALPTIAFAPGGGLVNLSLPANAVTALNAAGPLGWLEATGSFDQAGTIQLALATTGLASTVVVDSATVALTPVLSYNVTASGAGTTITAADSSLDLNWNLTPGTPVASGMPPTPWSSNKLLLSGGAAAFLASVTIPAGRSSVFFATSAVLPDASSSAYFYRWAAIPVTSNSGVAIPDAQATAFYSYDASQSSNATATALNNLASADPALATYVQLWDTVHGIPGYGQSGPNGDAYLLLASSVVAEPTLPDGTYLGGYHVALTLSGGGQGSTQWGYVSVMPYPIGMAPATPDVQAPFVYTNYVPALAFTSTSLVVNGQPEANATVAIGQVITFSSTVTNVGTGPVQSFTVNLSYVLPSPLVPHLVAPTQSFGPLAVGAQQTVSLSWVVNESVTGDHGYFHNNFVLTTSWNGGVAPNGGVATDTVSVRIAPALIAVAFTPPTGALSMNVGYPANGSVIFNGSGAAVVNITAVASDGTEYLLTSAAETSGSFNLPLYVLSNMPSGTYSIVINATYNDRSATATIPNSFTVAGAPAPATPFWQQKLLGLEVLYWILIAVAVLAGILAFLFLARRTARGKLVECGECGALIPENATQCPQCGAEFEQDLVRCSRCGATIPANSAVCPECAAQLLGSPDQEARDPERQGFADVVERFRLEAKKELGDNYSEGAFWDWWKRQPTYLSFSQYRLQQSQGTRAGMSAPQESTTTSTEAPTAPTTARPPRGGGGAATAAPMRARPAATAPPASTTASRSAPATARAAPTPAPAPAAPAPAAASGGPAMKPCSNCGKEIPPDYLVCPFCGAVTQ